MSWLSKLVGADKAIEGVVTVATKGMDLLDMSKMTAQERIIAFKEIVKATSSGATAISRRHLLWAILGGNGLSLVVGLFWVALDDMTRLDNTIKLTQVVMGSPAMLACISFYLLTHITGAMKK